MVISANDQREINMRQYETMVITCYDLRRSTDAEVGPWLVLFRRVENPCRDDWGKRKMVILLIKRHTATM